MSCFQFVQQHRAQYAVRHMCQALEVSRSGYYAWLKRPLSRRAREDGILLAAIRVEHRRSHRTYGSLRVYHALARANIRCGRHRVARLMKWAGLQGIPRPKRKGSTRSEAGRSPAPDLVERDFTASRPNEKWVADITYIPTQEGWLYLAVVMDLFSRRIVGWSMQRYQTDDLVIKALDMAVGGREVPAGLIHHSDQGGQYTSTSTRALLNLHQMRASMGSKGDCFDNATMESFVSSLKREWTHRRRYVDRAEARLDLFRYIEVFYNRERLHSTLGYVSPAEFEELHNNTP